jgi:hypothetical protein
MQIKDVTEADARLIRAVWNCVGPTATRKILERFHSVERYANRNFTNALECRGSVNIKQAAIDVIINTCGVEYLGQRKRNREHVYYCNSGDGYSATIMFDGEHLRVGCWADLVERNLISERGSY